MNIYTMGCRYEHLQKLIAGYEKTHTYLIEWDGSQLLPWFVQDDMGMYYFITKLVYLTGVSLDSALRLFFYGTMIMAIITGFLGFCLMYKNWLSRCVGLCGFLASAYLAGEFLDTYQAYVSIALAVIPWALYLFNTKKISFPWYLFCFIAGIGIGYGHYVRAYATMPTLIFLSTIIALHRWASWRQKYALFTFLVAGLSIPVIHMNSVYHQYRTFATQHLPDKPIDSGQHNFWHTIYCGLGFLNNDYGLKWDDQVAIANMQQMNPTITAFSPAYETALRNEVMHLVRTKKTFIWYTLWAKIGILLMLILCSANIGLLLQWLYPLAWQILLAFFAAISFASLFILIAIPYPGYNLAITTLGILLCITSIGNAIKERYEKTV